MASRVLPRDNHPHTWTMSEGASANAGGAMDYVSQAPGAQGPQLMQMGSLDAQRHPSYPIQSSSGKSDVQYAPGGAYAPPLKESDQEHGAQVDPSIASRRDVTAGYTHVRQDQPAYRLDLLQTDPNLESGSALSDQGALLLTRPSIACISISVESNRRARGRLKYAHLFAQLCQRWPG